LSRGELSRNNKTGAVINGRAEANYETGAGQ
jgi:hypothetical protein